MKRKIIPLQQKPTIYILDYIPPAISWKLLVKVGKSLCTCSGVVGHNYTIEKAYGGIILYFLLHLLMKSTLKVHNPRVIILLICINDVHGKELSF